jgi:hypothetical protein
MFRKKRVGFEVLHKYISFPALSEEEIRCLARLTWYTPIAKSYVQEHLNEHAEFTVYVCKQDEHLICAKLQSRHAPPKHIYYGFCMMNVMSSHGIVNVALGLESSECVRM